ncbi:MAG: dienelactone hydrolase family protein [Planctomycetales bacterium]|nr:dienelactone hydrolase family protein [Planctomycetales bacterium]
MPQLDPASTRPPTSWTHRLALLFTGVTMLGGLAPLRCLAQDAPYQAPDALPLSRLVERNERLGEENLERVEAYVDRLTLERIEARQARWRKGLAQEAAAREAWREQQRLALRYVLGDRDARIAESRLSTETPLGETSVVAANEWGKVHAVRWPVFDDVEAHGLLLIPAAEPHADILLLGAADESPESVAGVGSTSDSTATAQAFWRAGCRVLIPLSVSRGNEASGDPRVRRLNTTHREFLWRLAFFVGRHPWGYELATNQTGLDALLASRDSSRPLAVVGFADGGDAALHLIALDSRIDVAWIAGSWGSRDRAFSEPIDRCVYDSIDVGGAAELASLRTGRIVVEAAARPSVDRPEPWEGRDDAGTGSIATIPWAEVQGEWARLERYERIVGEDPPRAARLFASEEGSGAWGSELAWEQVRTWLELDEAIVPEPPRLLEDQRGAFDATARQVAWVRQWIEHGARLADASRAKRERYWSRADRGSARDWDRSTLGYREELRESVIGRLPPPSGEPDVRSVVVERTETWTSYEVVMDVGDGMILTGVMVVPHEALQAWQRAIEDGTASERRWPVVVMQHGRNGRPYLLCQSDAHEDSYHAVGARLAERGFIVFAPQHLYLGEEAYRVVQRKCFALGMTFFAPMVRQHERLLEYLGSVPVVDPTHIGFYGKSYGGKSAMLIPAVLEGYTCSICSADFNEQVWKHTGLEHAFCFPFTLEYEHTEFDFADRFNYSELAGLIAPRWFMVERGHSDGVSLDSWVAYEYAPVRLLYDQLGRPERTRIEFFEGGHEINGVGTFEFLEQWSSIEIDE